MQAIHGFFKSLRLGILSEAGVEFSWRVTQKGISVGSPHVMKQVLLGVTGVRAEMGRCKMVQPLFTRPAARKIKFLQGSFNPDINRKSLVKPVAEQEHAIGNFFADPMQGHQLFASGLIVQRSERLQIQMSVGDAARGLVQVGGAKPHFAGAQIRLAGGGQTLRCWKSKGARVWLSGGPRKCARFAKAFAEQGDNLADLDDLLGGGEDE